MSSLNLLKRFVFNGFLLDDSLNQLEADGISITKGEKIVPITRVNETDFSPVIIHNANRMASVYIAFFCLENAVRELIQQRLSEVKGLTWWKDAIPTRIQEYVVRLQAKEALYRYHAQRSINDMGYTTFGNLAQIITFNWTDFSDLFPDQHWINSRFNDLEMSRNIIMHTGILPQIEIERIESIARDWVRQVG